MQAASSGDIGSCRPVRGPLAIPSMSEPTLAVSTSTSATAVAAVRRRPRTTSLRFLRSREDGSSSTIPQSLTNWAEGCVLRRLDKGRYVELDHPAAQVRSTISIAFSHDGRFFASTHGDHTVKVFEYPSGRQIACLEGHPRTPWTVRFHPRDPRILASGCLGSDCRVWDIERRLCIRRHNFGASISCVSFSPDGELLAVTSGRELLLWDYMAARAPGTFSDWETRRDSTNAPGRPRELIQGANPFHLVDFHPSGTMLITGEKNRHQSSANHSSTAGSAAAADEQQFTLKLVVHRFDRRADRKFVDSVLVVPRAVAYNDAGIHFSPCGTMLAACIPMPHSSSTFRIAVMSLIPRRDAPVGTVLFGTPLDRGRVTALTNLKFSATSQHLLAGFSFRPTNPVLRSHAEHYAAISSRTDITSAAFSPSVPQVRVVDIYQVAPLFPLIRSLCADMDLTDGHGGGAEDEINVAVFAPTACITDGVVYGTQRGRIRMFQQATGPMPKACSSFASDEGYVPSKDHIVANTLVDRANNNADEEDPLVSSGSDGDTSDDTMQDPPGRVSTGESSLPWAPGNLAQLLRPSSTRAVARLARDALVNARSRVIARAAAGVPNTLSNDVPMRDRPSRHNSV